jgi:hypothetical protein
MLGGSDRLTGWRVACRIGEGQIMQKDRRVPAWLARRTYYKRIERWAKPGKARQSPPPAGSETGTGPQAEPPRMPSNVVPFPQRAGRPERRAFQALRGVGTA